MNLNFILSFIEKINNLVHAFTELSYNKIKNIIIIIHLISLI